jgi:hypothetical protein
METLGIFGMVFTNDRIVGNVGPLVDYGVDDPAIFSDVDSWQHDTIQYDTMGLDTGFRKDD